MYRTSRIHIPSFVLSALWATAVAVAVARPAVAQPAASAELAPPELPFALAQARSFAGSITYVGRQVSGKRILAVHGQLLVSAGGWSLKETGPGSELRAGPGGATLRSHSATFTVDDALEADALVNSWAVALGQLNAGPLTASRGTPHAWSGAGGVRVYLDAAGARMLGISNSTSRLNESFVFGDWVEIDGIAMPQRILRLRGGAADAAFSIDSYAVTRNSFAYAPTGAQPAQANAATGPASAQRGAQKRTADTARTTARFFNLFAILALGLLAMAWLRRDAFTGYVCRRLAADARAFRDAGTSVFVSPEGAMYFDGCTYRVGTLFYGRAARVQTSPLFLRVSTSGTGHAIVVAKKFRPLNRRRPAGFSLVEVMVAMAVFALVVVGGVFPALISISQADAFAARRATAIRLASNALTDEELAAAYGAAIDDGSATATQDGMQVTVTVTPSQLAGAHDVSVAVSDSSHTLARVATVLGPPVPTPPPQSASLR
jgi:prepilin-type N-terminal cleavage/methylation domain-containing protein